MATIYIFDGVTLQTSNSDSTLTRTYSHLGAQPAETHLLTTVTLPQLFPLCFLRPPFWIFWRVTAVHSFPDSRSPFPVPRSPFPVPVLVTSARKDILKNYYKAMFVREPFARLASAYRDKVNDVWFKRFVIPNKTTEELKKEAAVPFSTFIKSVLSSNASTFPGRGYIEDQHWRPHERICPCEIDYDFIGHFENLGN